MVAGFPQTKSPLRGLFEVFAGLAAKRKPQGLAALVEPRLATSYLAETGCMNCKPISWTGSLWGDLAGILMRAGSALDHLRPTRALMAPTRLLVPLPTALSGRVRTVTSPLTLVRQLRR